MGRRVTILVTVLVIVNQMGASRAFPMAERPQRHVDGMFTSELSRLQSARLIQKYAMDILRPRPERGMEEEDGGALGLTGPGEVPEFLDTDQEEEEEVEERRTQGDFQDEMIDDFRHVLPSQPKHDPEETIPLYGTGELPGAPPAHRGTW